MQQLEVKLLSIMQKKQPLLSGCFFTSLKEL
jgi:hypothetical protein